MSTSSTDSPNGNANVIDAFSDQIKALQTEVERLRASSPDPYGNVRLLCTNANRSLADKISQQLGIKLSNSTVGQFANTEVRVLINDNIRGCDVFIVTTGSSYEGRSVNDHLIETIMMVDACRRSDANKITVIMPCYPYARQDKKDRARAPIGANVVASMLEHAGATRVITMDLHADQIQGMFNIPVDNLFAEKYVIKHLMTSSFLDHDKDDYVIVAPDVGAAKRAMHLAEAMGMRDVIMSKKRDYSRPNTIASTTLVGKVEGKIAIIFDDLSDTGGTLEKAAEDLMQHGAVSVLAIVTHGVLSGPAIERLNDHTSHISELICTNTLPQDKNQELCDKLTVVDISELLANAVREIATNGSLSSLF